MMILERRIYFNIIRFCLFTFSCSFDRVRAVSEPKVAFHCGFRNRFLNSDGIWETDNDHNAVCVQGMLDVLKYCQKVYPNFKITNVAESHNKVLLSNWCLDHNSTSVNCNHHFTLSPYLCLFNQSFVPSKITDVPEGCVYDYSEEPTSCQSLKSLARKSRETCNKIFPSYFRSTIKSIKVLKPCGLGLFSALEYLCCADDKSVGYTDEVVEHFRDSNFPKTIFDEEDTDELSPLEIESSIDGTYSNAVTEDAVEILPTEKTFKPTLDKIHAAELELFSANQNDKYYQISSPMNESLNYEQALTRLVDRHKHLVTMVIAEWDQLERKYDASDKTTEKAKKFRSEMTEHYKNIIANLELKTKKERRKLSDTHEFRLSIDFDHQYRTLERNLTKLCGIDLSENASGAVTFDHFLMHSSERLLEMQTLIRLTVQRRFHLLDYYVHTLKNDPTKALSVRESLAGHLEASGKRLNKSIDACLIKFSPQTSRKILNSLRAFKSKLHEDLIALGIADKYPSVDNDDNDGQKILQRLEENLRNTQSTKDLEIRDASNQNIISFPHHEDTSTALMLQNDIAQQIDSKSQNVHSAPFFYIFCAATIIAIIATIFFAVVAKNRSHVASGSRFIQVDRCSPEERHVIGMQANGYCNPTYKYFEQA